MLADVGSCQNHWRSNTSFALLLYIIALEMEFEKYAMFCNISVPLIPFLMLQ